MKREGIMKRVVTFAMASVMALSTVVFSGTGQVTKAASLDAASSINYSTILGRASNYGLLANKINQTSHMETTVAVKTLNQSSGQANEIDLCGKDPVWIMVGELDAASGELDFGSRVHKDIDTASSEKMVYYLDTTQEVYNRTNKTRTYQDIRASIKEKSAIDASIQGMIDTATTWSATLAGKDALDLTGMYTVDGANKFVINIPDTYADKTIYINVDDYPGLINSLNAGGGSMMQLNKPESTVVVFNYSATDVTIADFEVNGLGTAQDHSGNDSEKNQNIDTNICQKVIWNLPNATKVDLKKSVGLFLVPNTSANVNIVDTAAGWIATGGTVNVSSEFHYIYHGRSAGFDNQFQFGAKKALTKTLSKEKAEADQVETITIKEGAYTFELYETDATYNTSGLTPLKTTANAANSEFRFDYITYDTEGTYYYVIKEKNPGSVSDNITNSDGEIDIKLVVTKDANEVFHFTVSSEKYVTAADKAAGKSVANNNNITADGTVFTFGRFYNKVDVGNLEVTVLDEDTKEPVPGAKVKITNPDGSTKEYTTDADGKITVKDTPIGDYKITVTEVPDGYKVTVGEEATKKVEEGKTATHVAEITPTGGLKITVLEEDSDEPVKDAVVKVTGPDGTVTEYTTDENGEILVNPTETGDYQIVVTKVPEGKKVTVGETKTVTVEKLKIAEHVAKINKVETKKEENTTEEKKEENTTEEKKEDNTPKGNLEITVRDEVTNDPVPNATVNITDPTGDKSDHTTDSAGKVTLTDVPVGDYTVEVTSVPEGYTVTTGQTSTVTVKENETVTETVKVNTPTQTNTPTTTPNTNTTVTSTNQTTDSKKDTTVATGDTSKPYMAMVFMGGSIIGMAILTLLKKKED